MNNCLNIIVCKNAVFTIGIFHLKYSQMQLDVFKSTTITVQLAMDTI